MATDTKTLDEQKHLIYDIAEAIAPTWEQRRADVEEVATPGPGMDAARASPARRNTVLELAAGVGETGFEAAAIVGEAGRLITSDFSPAMLEAARRRGASWAWRTPTTGSSTASASSLTTTRSTGCCAGSVTCSCRIQLRLSPRLAACFVRAAGWRSRSGAHWNETPSSRSSESPSWSVDIAPPDPRRHRGRSAPRARNGSTGSSGTPVSPRCASRKCMAVSSSRTSTST